MKQREPFDKIKTPESWKKQALERVLETEKAPVLNRWQMKGIAAVTAVLVMSLIAMPLLYSREPVKYKPAEKEESSAVQTAADTDEVPEIKIMTKEETVEAEKQKLMDDMRTECDYVEAATVIDFEKMSDGTTRIFALREPHKAGNGVLCVSISADADTSMIRFGEMVALGYKEYTADDTIEERIHMDINGRTFTAQECVGMADCDVCKDIGVSTDPIFTSVLASAEAAAKGREGDASEYKKRLVISNFGNGERVKPDTTAAIMQQGNEIKSEVMTTLIDDTVVEKEGQPAQLYVVKIESIGSEVSIFSVEKTDEAYRLHLGDKEGTLFVTGRSKPEILNVDIVPDSNDLNSAYLLIDLIDEQHTGNLRGWLDIVISMENTGDDGQVEMVYSQPAERSIAMIIDTELGYRVKAGDSIDVMTVSNREMKTMFVCEFELDYSNELSDDQLYAIPNGGHSVSFGFGNNEPEVKITAEAQGEYMLNCGCITKDKEENKLVAELMLVYDGLDIALDADKMTEVLDNRITFKFEKP